jgi:flavodoxin I
MKYAIVYSSKTGNTAALADRLHDILPHEHCVYFGDTAHYSPDLGADLIFAGFWTDKGSCDDRTRVFLKNLQNRSFRHSRICSS